MITLVDAEGLAKILNIPESTVNYLRRKGRIRSYRVGKHHRYNPEEALKEFQGNKN